MTSSPIVSYAKILGLFGSGLLTGGTLYISTFAVPTVLDSANQLTIHKQWCSLYSSGKKSFPPVAVFTSLAFSFAAWHEYTIESPKWAHYAISAVSTAAIIPFTLIGMMGNIRRLQEMGKAVENRAKLGAEVQDERSLQEEVRVWAKLNFVRGVMHVFAFLVAAQASVV